MYIYTHTRMCIYIYIYIYTYTHMYAYTYIYIYICIATIIIITTSTTWAPVYIYIYIYIHVSFFWELARTIADFNLNVEMRVRNHFRKHSAFVFVVAWLGGVSLVRMEFEVAQNAPDSRSENLEIPWFRPEPILIFHVTVLLSIRLITFQQNTCSAFLKLLFRLSKLCLKS